MVLLAILSLYFLCADSFREHACLKLGICADGSGIWLLHWVLVCAFGKALRMQECGIVLGSCSFRESWEKKLEVPRWESVCFSFFFLLAGNAHGGGDTHTERCGASWMD